MQCLTACPDSYNSDAWNECKKCNSPCSTCSGTADNCTTCISGYYLNGTSCLEEYNMYKTLYPFPFLAMTIAFSIILILTLICCRKAKWL